MATPSSPLKTTMEAHRHSITATAGMMVLPAIPGVRNLWPLKNKPMAPLSLRSRTRIAGMAIQKQTGTLTPLVVQGFSTGRIPPGVALQSTRPNSTKTSMATVGLVSLLP